MKKFIYAVVMLLALPFTVSAQNVNPQMDENNPDSIKVTYVPNSFKDNWELSLSGGAVVLFSGIGRVNATTDAPNPKGKNVLKFYDTYGFVGEIAATKWFNPYVGARLAWQTGWLPFTAIDEKKYKTNAPASWHNYGHIDMLWDWTTQFGGYNPDRKYDAVPYIHVGIVGNPACNVMVAGGLGLLNRVHLSEHWLLNIDLRASSTSARKFGRKSGIAIDTELLIGVSYRFSNQYWKKKVYNPYGPEVRRLKEENEDLQHQVSRLRMDNDELARKAQEVQREKYIKEQVTKEVFAGLPDTMEMTVYYAINSSTLSSYEQAHLRTYLRLIKVNDPANKHQFVVTGTADKGTGTLEYNKTLAAARAAAIKQALVENGVTEEQIEVRTEIIPSGDAKMARASHVIMYPLPKED